VGLRPHLSANNQLTVIKMWQKLWRVMIEITQFSVCTVAVGVIFWFLIAILTMVLLSIPPTLNFIFDFFFETPPFNMAC